MKKKKKLGFGLRVYLTNSRLVLDTYIRESMSIQGAFQRKARCATEKRDDAFSIVRYQLSGQVGFADG